MNDKTHGPRRAGSLGDSPSPSGAPYTVLARKYRPTNFAELIGQHVMVRTLRNAFAQDRIAHAFMLTGVRGVGKTTTARILARALNYAPKGAERGQGVPTLDMSEEGEHCAAILEGRHLDVIEMDAASNTGIDDVREIIEAAKYWPNSARYKVYIVDEVHMLSKAAFNGLLKTLEEPPPHVKFIFATTELRKVPVTVLSRCQRFDLRRVDTADLIRHLEHIALAEDAAITPDALALIARAAEGSVRDALSLLDRAIAYGGGAAGAYEIRSMLGLADRRRILDLLEVAMRGDTGAALETVAQLVREGAEPAPLLADLAEAVHQITRIKTIGPSAADTALSEAERARICELSQILPVPALARAWQMLLKGYEEVAASPRPAAAAEMVLVRLAFAAKGPTPGELQRRLSDKGAAVAPPEAHTGPAADPQSRVRASEPEPAGDKATAGPEPVRLRSFADVVALAGEKRDLKLKRALTEEVRLVSFGPGIIEFAAGGSAPPDLAVEIGRKLSEWTGTPWIASLSQEEGAPTLGEASRAEAADEMTLVRDHPAVKEVMARFPDARIAEVRPIRDRTGEE